MFSVLIIIGQITERNGITKKDLSLIINGNSLNNLLFEYLLRYIRN